MKTATALVAVGLLQVAGGVLLYRGRVLSDASWLDSDVLVFLLPLLVGAAGSSLLLWKARTDTGKWNRLLVAVLGGFGAAVIAEYLFVFLAFNRYGT